jgi:predicted PurR-regulated permease PerM
MKKKLSPAKRNAVDALVESPRQRGWLWLGLALAVLAVAAIYCFYGTLWPWLVSLGLAYLFNPLILWMQRRGLKRPWAVSLLLALLLASLALALAWLIPVLIDQAKGLMHDLPQDLGGVLAWLNDTGETLGVAMPGPQRLQALLQQKLLNGGQGLPGMDSAKGLFGGLGRAAVLVMTLILIPVLFFFLLRDLPQMARYFAGLVPPRHRPLAARLARQVDDAVAGYIRGQLIVSAMLGAALAAILTLMGVKFGLAIGLLAGALNLIPYVGQVAGMLLALLMALVDFHGWPRVVALPLIFMAMNFIEGTFLAPKIVGDKVGLSPLQTLLALLVGGGLAGFMGLLVAIPVAAAGKAVWKDVVDEYRRSRLYAGG